MCVVAPGPGPGPGGEGGAARGEAVCLALELGLARRRRAHALRYGALNAALLLLLAYDLSSSCPSHRSALHYAELGAAALLGASLLHHAARLLPPRPRRRLPLPVTARQRRLLALPDADLDSSFRVVDSPRERARRSASPVPLSPGPEELSLSLSPARSWRASTPPAPPGSPASPGSDHDHDHDPDRSLRDEFISDKESLGNYLKQYAARERALARRQEGGEWRAAPPRPALSLALSPPHYALASPPSDKLSGEEGEGAGGCAGGAGGAGGAGPGGGVRVWWRLRLDPLRLTQFNLNLRLWLQMTILERLTAALDAAELALERLGLPASLAQVSLARLQALAEGAAPGLAALLPYLEPYPDLQYTVRRIRELAEGGCLSGYRWSGGGRGWAEGEGARPTDAELLLHLFAAYMDRQLPAAPAPPGPRARPFSAHHLSAAASVAPGVASVAPVARDLAIHRVAQRPPHYVLLLEGETLDVGRGRNNLLHTLLLFIAAAARDSPPALRRLQLGPAGLNVLWVIGR